MKVGSRKTEVDIPKLVLQPPLPASHLHYAGISPFYPLCRPPTCPTLASPPKGGDRADFFIVWGKRAFFIVWGKRAFFIVWGRRKNYSPLQTCPGNIVVRGNN
jgi:hypothetical protein